MTSPTEETMDKHTPVTDLKSGDDLTIDETKEKQIDRRREALLLLAHEGYEIYHNGARLVLTGKQTWRWLQITKGEG